MMSEQDAWQVLGIDPTTDTEAIRDAYRTRARFAHPDAGGSREEWDRLQEAYAMLAAAGAASSDDRLPTDRAGQRLAARWRGLRRRVRVPVILVLGLAVLVPVGLWLYQATQAAEELGADMPWQVAAVLLAYLVAWWLWICWREFRRPTVRPLRWYLVRVPEDAEGQAALIEAMRESERRSQEAQGGTSSRRAGDL